MASAEGQRACSPVAEKTGLRPCIASLLVIFILQKLLGAYTVRYLFVTCGFSSAETENLGMSFLLGRAPKREHLEPF
jgi:hypothetical protein